MPFSIFLDTSFNSLQTGKRIQSQLKQPNDLADCMNLVSIPFKRESVSKEYDTSRTICSQVPKYVSIPFKRERVAKVLAALDKANKEVFQFPSNGKAYPKIRRARLWRSHWKFQFPSNGKAYPKPNMDVHQFFGMGFNSLQTGKRIQS